MKKSMIPNLLTLIRICLVPILIILFLFKLYIPATILAIIGAITDRLDGKLARMWKVTSLKGAKLDDVADKVFSIGLLLCLSFKFKSLIIIMVLEIITMLLNYYYHRKTNRTETLMVGKFKMTFLFITIILYFITLINGFNLFNNGFRFATINLQILCLISYFIKHYKVTHNIKDEYDPYKMINENDTIVIENINDLYTYMKRDD